MKKYTISTIIPFYNCKDTLSRMLDSILSSSVLPMEIILVDDGSDDGSLKIATNYASDHNFIKVYSKGHHGVAASRNLGLSEATGDFISFMDADDYIEPDMYEKMLDAIYQDKEGDVSGCICGYFTHKNDTETSYFKENTTSLTSEEILKGMFCDDNIRGFLFTRLFKRELISNMTFATDINMCEDLLFQTKLFTEYSCRFAYTAIPLYHYIQNSSSLTGTSNYFKNGIFIYKPAFEKITLLLDKAYVKDSYNSILDFSMYTLLKEYRNNKSSDTVRQVKLLKKEMAETKAPLANKSKRRIAYEYLPVGLLLMLF